MVEIPKKKSLPVDINSATPESHQEYIRTVDDDLSLLFDRDVANQEAIEQNATDIATKEDSLGNPASDGQHLASTAAGVRSWVTPPVPFSTMVVITGTGTWTKPAGITTVFLELWGGGGGGAGGGTSSNGGSGGGGAYGCGLYSITGNLSVTIGGGGSAGSGGGSPSNGGNGGATSVSGGSLPANVSAGGGGQGTTGGAGASGTPGAGVTLGISGGRGDHFGGSAINHATKGGASPRGGQSSFTAIVPGGGGQGGGFSSNGTVGAAGLVVIWY